MATPPPSNPGALVLDAERYGNQGKDETGKGERKASLYFEFHVGAEFLVEVG